MAGVCALIDKDPLPHSGAQSVSRWLLWNSTGYGSSKYMCQIALPASGGERETRLNTWKVRETCRETAELYFKCSPSFFTCCSPYYSAPLAHGRDYKADKVIHTTIPAYSETCQSPVMKCRDVDLSMKCRPISTIYLRCKSYQHIHYSNTYWGQWIYQKHADHHDQNYFSEQELSPFPVDSSGIQRSTWH